MNLGSSTDERAKRSRAVVRLNFGMSLGQALVTALNQAASSSPAIVPSFSKKEISGGKGKKQTNGIN